jgi:hypothetical protein
VRPTAGSAASASASLVPFHAPPALFLVVSFFVRCVVVFFLVFRDLGLVVFVVIAITLPITGPAVVEELAPLLRLAAAANGRVVNDAVFEMFLVRGRVLILVVVSAVLPPAASATVRRSPVDDSVAPLLLR